MRTIEIDTAVFAKIWAYRLDGEESENAILRRLLGLQRQADSVTPTASDGTKEASAGRARWRDDVRQALEELGGTAALADIYSRVRAIRRGAGRTLPPSTEDIIRRELENNSSDSHAFTGHRDWFECSEGKGGGVWGLRSQAIGE